MLYNLYVLIIKFQSIKDQHDPTYRSASSTFRSFLEIIDASSGPRVAKMVIMSIFAPRLQTCHGISIVNEIDAHASLIHHQVSAGGQCRTPHAGRHFSCRLGRRERRREEEGEVGGLATPAPSRAQGRRRTIDGGREGNKPCKHRSNF